MISTADSAAQHNLGFPTISSEEGPVPRGLSSPSAPLDGGTLFHHRATARSQRPDGKISTRGPFDATCGGPPLKPEVLNI